MQLKQLMIVFLAMAAVGAVSPSAAKAQDRDSDRREARGRLDRDSDRDSDRHGGLRDRDSDSDSDSDRRGRRRGRGECIDVNLDGICDFGTGDRRECRDRDNDGFCDSRRDDRVCVDRNRDGRCDRRSTLPEMIGAILIDQGRRTGQWARWLPANVRDARWDDADRNGVPERAVFVDRRGRVVQAWHDVNRDGRADLVQFVRNGRVVRSIRG